MASHLHSLQPVGLPTMIPRAPQSAQSSGIAAMTRGEMARQDQHPDLPSYPKTGQNGTDPYRIEPPLPADPPTGPPPAFELSVLEALARALHEPWRLAAMAVQADWIARDLPAKTAWQAPETPEPALIDRQL